MIGAAIKITAKFLNQILNFNYIFLSHKQKNKGLYLRVVNITSLCNPSDILDLFSVCICLGNEYLFLHRKKLS